MSSHNSVSCSPSLRPSPALRHLSPNYSHGAQRASSGKASVEPLNLNACVSLSRETGAKRSREEKAPKRVRPNLTLDLSVLATPTASGTSSLLSLRRQGSWEEGCLADSTVEDRAGKLSEEATLRAGAFVSELHESGVKLLAIDFDLTMVSMHTGGRWWGTVETLARSIRPLFKAVIPDAQRLGIEVCVCTLSSQANLIRKVLELSLGGRCDTTQIRIRGGEKRRLVREDGDLDEAEFEGCRKQRHIASILAARTARGEGGVQRGEIVLIDDDAMNTGEAAESGMRALVFDPDNPLSLLGGMNDEEELSRMSWQ
jgi:hypothetical protein